MHKKIEIDILIFILTQAVFLLFFFKENLLTIILGIVLGIVLILLTRKIPKNNITKIILFIISILLSIITFKETILFIQDNLLKNYSIYIISIVFLFISFYLVKKNYHTFIKSLEISFYILIFFKIISLILIIPKINISYLRIPQLEVNYNFTIIALLILYFYKAIHYLTSFSINIKRTIITLINPLFMKLITVLVLSKTLFNIYKYPYINYLKSIRYFDFIERIDGILSFEYLICFFYLFTFLLLFIKIIYQSLILSNCTRKRL